MTLFLYRHGANLVMAAVFLTLLLISFAVGASCDGDLYPAVAKTDTIWVPIEEIREAEPETIQTFLDRIRWKTLPPETVKVATGGPEPEVGLFCAAPIATALGDTTPKEPVALIRSGSYTEGWFFGRSRFVATAPLSTGGAIQPVFAPRGSFTFRASEDAVQVQESRWSWVRPVVEAVTWGGAGYGACRLEDALR